MDPSFGRWTFHSNGNVLGTSKDTSVDFGREVKITAEFQERCVIVKLSHV